MRKIGTLALLLALLLPASALAQATSTGPTIDQFLQQLPAPADTGLPSCFDYYRFGSTPTRISAELASARAGGQIAFSGSVENQNKYPIVDATVYAKVFKQNASPDKNPNGPDVVGFFPILEHANLAPGAMAPFTYTWDIPQDAEAGAYRIATYVVADDRFNYLGLTFTDDVTGGFYDFSVVNDATGGVRFDKNAATVNGAPYRFAVFSPAVPADVGDIPVTVSVKNTTNTAYDGEVDWKLYSWDSLQPGNLITESKAPVKVGPNASASLSYAVSDTGHTVYYLVGTLSTAGGSQSIAALRFVRTGKTDPRINSAGVTAYPAAADTTAFVCFHSSGSTDTPNGRVELSVIPQNMGIWNFLAMPVATKSYEGVIPGDIKALAVPVGKALSSFDIDAKVYEDGKLIDSVVVPVRCDELGVACATDMTASVITVIVAIIILIGLFLLMRRKKHPVSMPPAV